MTPEFKGMMSVNQLNQLSQKLTADLISSTSKISRLLNYQITLLEVFSREIKKLERIETCDYELAYVCCEIARTLCIWCEKNKSKDTEPFIVDVRETLNRKLADEKVLINFLEKTAEYDPSSSMDPLITRLANLKASNKSPPPSRSTHGATTFINRFKYQECINPYELQSLMESNLKILLVDFRSAKEFNYSHIKFPEVVNIEPSHITTLLASKKTTLESISDVDLEDRLKMHIPDDQFVRFQNRHKFDLIVIYNLRYGSTMNDRFMALKDLIINNDVDGIPTSNPFQNLVEIITYKNKYISSRLKSYPLYLSGGLINWHNIYGDNSLEKHMPSQILTRPQASLSKGGSQSPSSSRSNSFTSAGNSLKSGAPSSPYLKNFGDYLSTAKSSTNTPVSNTFVPALANSSTSINNLDYEKIAGFTHTVPEHQVTSHQSIPPPQQQAPPQPRRSLSSGSFKPRSRSNSTLSIEQPLNKISSSPPTRPSARKSSSSSSASNPTKFLEQYATGLTNLGNSCYMNCILQCLGATPQLTKFFFPVISTSASNALSLQSYRKHINVNNKLGTKGILTNNFVTLLGNMFNNTGKFFTPQSFKKVVGSLSPGQQFATYDQQDCIEFLNFILDGLHEDLNQMLIDDPLEKKAITELSPEQEKTREILPVRLASTIEWERYLKLNFSIIVDYFQGQYLSHLRCLECNATSTTYNAFSILSLPIPEKLGSNSSVTLDDCLKEFTTTELLDDNNKWYCPNCKKFVKLTKKITITRLPEVLIIHFKRFKISTTGYINKMDTYVTYPVNDILDLTPYWPKVGTVINPKSNDFISKEKEQQIISTLPTRNQQSPFRYKLYGVANHYGNLSTGHYTAYVHKANDNKKTRGWCYFDDAKITYNCNENQVMNKNAYCLFYQRV